MTHNIFDFRRKKSFKSYKETEKFTTPETALNLDFMSVERRVKNEESGRKLSCGTLLPEYHSQFSILNCPLSKHLSLIPLGGHHIEVVGLKLVQGDV